MESKIAVTVDIVCLRPIFHPAEILLIQRGRPPFLGHWALPGGFVEEDEDLEAAALRELAEETSIVPAAIMQFHCFGKPGRDPRGRTVSIVYLAKVNIDQSGKAGDDASHLAWFKMNKLPELAFDHAEIIIEAIEYSQLNCHGHQS
jgi:8-oxo-dGTP diphosphatase